MKYTVTSDRVVGKKRGDTVDSADLKDVNVDALVNGGHLEPAKGTLKNNDTKEAQV